MLDVFFKSFAKYDLQFDEEQKVKLQSLLRVRKFRKHQYLLQQGDICRYKSFILHGLTRAYVVDERGQEHIIQFGIEGSWVEDLFSLKTGNPSEINIDCIEDAEVLQLSKENMIHLFDTMPQFDRYFRCIQEEAIVALAQRIAYNLSKPAAERYFTFITRFPHIEQRVPNHQIASYLGITPQSLSRVRRQAMDQKR